MWIRQYVSDMDNPLPGVRSRRPLRQAEVVVEDVDETIGDDFIYVAQVIRDFDPRLKIYANKWIEPNDFKKVRDLIDIWCPHIPDVLVNREKFDKYRSLGVFDEIFTFIRCPRLSRETLCL